MPCRSTMPQLPRNFPQPPPLHLELLDHQTHHPHRFMTRMSDFLQNRPQCFFLALQFLPQEFLPPPQLLPKNPRPRQPGQRHPSQKRRPLPLRSPLLAFQRIRGSRTPLRRSRKHAAFRALGRLPALHRPHKSRLRQFSQRIINLRPRNPRPVPHAPPLELQIRLIPMHRPLRQQTKQNQTRRSQHQPLPIPHKPPSTWPCYDSLRPLRAFSVSRLGCSSLRLGRLIPPPAPIPPLAPLHREPPIPRLGHRCPKNIQATNILVLRRHPAQFLVKPVRTTPRQLPHAPHSQNLKI